MSARGRAEAPRQARSGPLPGGPAMLAAAVVLAVTLVCILTGRRDREAAVVLAALCPATAVPHHPFRTHPDPAAPGRAGDREGAWELPKDFGLVGGPLTVASGRRALPGGNAGLPRLAVVTTERAA